MSSSGSLDNSGHALRTLFGGTSNFVIDADEFEHTFNTFLQKLLIKILSSARQKKINLNAVAFREPLTSLFSLKDKVVVTSAKFNLHSLHFSRMRFLCLFGFFILLVEITAEISDLSYRRGSIGRNFDQVFSEFLGFFESFLKSEDAEIFSFWSDNAKFARSDLLINTRLLQRLWYGLLLMLL